mmetsp:Transcript_48222/g.112583  ORF Transcript_48222/g.112583 Transcript_48222/m.112583 type:complete len:239 (+) Transcript_48222:80-796(+)
MKRLFKFKAWSSRGGDSSRASLSSSSSSSSKLLSVAGAGGLCICPFWSLAVGRRFSASSNKFANPPAPSSRTIWVNASRICATAAGSRPSERTSNASSISRSSVSGDHPLSADSCISSFNLFHHLSQIPGETSSHPSRASSDCTYTSMPSCLARSKNRSSEAPIVSGTILYPPTTTGDPVALTKAYWGSSPMTDWDSGARNTETVCKALRRLPASTPSLASASSARARNLGSGRTARE